MGGNPRGLKTVTLAYFSGTGGTKAAAEAFAACFSERGVTVTCVEIAGRRPAGEEDCQNTDLLMLLSPVYAFRLVSVVEQWTARLPGTQGTLGAVISVSGGGEVSPNTACRIRCKELLRRKGYRLIWEDMLIMPSNFATQAERRVNLRLIRALPGKAERIVAGILSGGERLTRPLVQDRLFAALGRGEHVGARLFGASIRASKACNLCHLCVEQCPAGNIRVRDGRLKFGVHCILCMKCLYRCPRHALTPRLGRFAVLKDGYDLDRLRKEAETVPEPAALPHESKLWQGVWDYLNE